MHSWWDCLTKSLLILNTRDSLSISMYPMDLLMSWFLICAGELSKVTKWLPMLMFKYNTFKLHYSINSRFLVQLVLKLIIILMEMIKIITPNSDLYHFIYNILSFIIFYLIIYKMKYFFIIYHLYFILVLICLSN